jgi:hypothetical protein
MQCIYNKGYAQSGQGLTNVGHTIAYYTPCIRFLYDDDTNMEDINTDEVESILYIAREISGMPHLLPHDAPPYENDKSIQDPAFEGE